MSNFHRIIWFDQQVKAHVFPNRGTLADKFEISVRQAQRDIDYLKETMGAPLKYDGRRRGYYYEDDTFVLPSIFINEDLKKLLNYMAYSYENFTQIPKAVEIGKLLKRLADDGEVDGEVPIFDLDKPIIQTYYKIFNSIKSKNKIKVFYKDPHRGDIVLIISPYKLFHKYKADYLVGHCEKEGFVTIRLDRIDSMECLKDKFNIELDFEEGEYSNLIRKEPFVARIQFKQTPSFGEGVRIKQVEEQVYDLEFFEIEDFINQLINIDYWGKIYSPKWLRERIRARCTQILDKLDL